VTFREFGGLEVLRALANGMQALDIAGTLLSSGAFLGRDVTVSLQRLDSSGQRNIGVRTGNISSAHRLWDEVREGFRNPTDRTFALQCGRSGSLR
jgi:hypothetical protein